MPEFVIPVPYKARDKLQRESMMFFSTAEWMFASAGMTIFHPNWAITNDS